MSAIIHHLHPDYLRPVCGAKQTLLAGDTSPPGKGWARVGPDGVHHHVTTKPESVTCPSCRGANEGTTIGL